MISGLSHIFVTGATSNTGVRFVTRLLEFDVRITALHHSDSTHHLPENPKIRFIRGDLNSISELNSELESLAPVDAVVNLAHIGFAAPVIELCNRLGVRRLVSISSTRRFTRFPEATARRVIEGESNIERSELDFTILRSTMIYGGGRDNNIRPLINHIRRRRIVPLVRGGRALVQPIFTDDLADAILRTLQNPDSTRRKSFNVAGSEPLSWRSMVEIAAAQAGLKPLFVPLPYPVVRLAAAVASRLPLGIRVSPDQIDRLLEDKDFDLSEARAALPGWNPRSFEEGVRLAFPQ